MKKFPGKVERMACAHVKDFGLCPTVNVKCIKETSAAQSLGGSVLTIVCL